MVSAAQAGVGFRHVPHALLLSSDLLSPSCAQAFVDPVMRFGISSPPSSPVRSQSKPKYVLVYSYYHQRFIIIHRGRSTYGLSLYDSSDEDEVQDIAYDSSSSSDSFCYNSESEVPRPVPYEVIAFIVHELLPNYSL